MYISLTIFHQKLTNKYWNRQWSISISYPIQLKLPYSLLLYTLTSTNLPSSYTNFLWIYHTSSTSLFKQIQYINSKFKYNNFKYGNIGNYWKCLIFPNKVDVWMIEVDLKLNFAWTYVQLKFLIKNDFGF